MSLNLARKWRSKNFEDIVGQDIIIKLLKNSLYKNIIFPSYLLSGMRGTGKTTIARVFAAALNCKLIEQFQIDPLNYKIPCLLCDSCIAMNKNNHPDFMEIDAASNTGVDNIRNIIETASFMPILGTRKIYLIDEAHMLSKAAFNALLKILEEPNFNIVFILATTEYNKIIDTIRSRSFQLIFDPIDKDSIIKQLEIICKNEDIKYDLKGLEFLAEESQGSLRDAINLLEKIRLYDVVIDENNISMILNYPSKNDLENLFLSLFNSNFNDFILSIENIKFKRFRVMKIFNYLIYTLKSIIKYKTSISVDIKENIVGITQNIELEKILDIFYIIIESEYSLNKDSSFYSLELLLFKIYRIINQNESISNNKKLLDKDKKKIFLENIDNLNKNNIKEDISNINNIRWQNFLIKLNEYNQLLYSIFSNGSYKDGILKLDSSLEFSKDLFNEDKNWIKIAKDILKIDQLKILFVNKNSDNNNTTLNSKIISSKKVDNNLNNNNIEDSKIKNIEDNKKKVLKEIDKDSFPKTNLLLKLFPGKLYEQ